VDKCSELSLGGGKIERVTSPRACPRRTWVVVGAVFNMHKCPPTCALSRLSPGEQPSTTRPMKDIENLRIVVQITCGCIAYKYGLDETSKIGGEG
jgi:hypothetical protein